MTPSISASRRTGPRPASPGRGRLLLLTVGLALGVVPGCASGNLPKPIPDSARRRVTQGEQFLRRASPLEDSQRLEESAAVRNWEGRAPIPPHWSAAFRAQAGAHQNERYVHSLTARANAHRNLPTIPASDLEPVVPTTAPVTPSVPHAGFPGLPGSGADSGGTATVRTPPRTPPAIRPARPAYVPPTRTPTRTTTTTARPVMPPSTWTPPRTTSTVSRPPVSRPPVSRPPSTIPTSVTVGTGVPSFSMSSLPAHLRDVSALSARESSLADQSIQLGLERRAVLRMARALRDHQSQGSTTSREALDDAFREYRSSATTSAGLSLSSGHKAFASAEPAIRDRLSRVQDDRKAVLRLLVALQSYQSSPSAANGAALATAVAKYQGR